MMLQKDFQTKGETIITKIDNFVTKYSENTIVLESIQNNLNDYQVKASEANSSSFLRYVLLYFESRINYEIVLKELEQKNTTTKDNSSNNARIHSKSDSFITLWDTNLSDSTTITLPLDPQGNYNFTIDWGDGSKIQTINSYKEASHSYAENGTYTITIDGIIEGFGLQYSGMRCSKTDAIMLIDILQWGNMKFTNNPCLLAGTNIKSISAHDTPILFGIQGAFFLLIRTI